MAGGTHTVSDEIKVTYQGFVLSTRVPFRYAVTITVDDMETGIVATVWGRRRAERVMRHMIEHGNELLNQYGVAAGLAAEIYSMRREAAMSQVQVGQSVKLLVDIGPFKKGRVCKVTEVAEPSFYEARGGAPEWEDERYPVLVLPVHSPTDNFTLGPKDVIPLRRGEFGPLDTEIDE